MACYRKSGKRNMVRVLADSTSYLKGDIVQYTQATGSRTIGVAATNEAVLGITDAAITNATAGVVDVLSPGDQVWVEIVSGTMTDAVVGTYADIVDEDGITLTESNNDFLILGWDGVTTNWCYGVFVHLDVSIGT